MANRAINFFIVFIGLVVLLVVLKEMQHIFIPLLLAYFLYFVFEPINTFLRKKKLPDSLILIADLAVISGIIYGVSKIIISQFLKFSESMPIYEVKLNKIISSATLSFGIDDPNFTNFNIAEVIKHIDYSGILSGFFSSTLSIVSTLFLVLFFFIFVFSGHSVIFKALKKRFAVQHIEPDHKDNNQIEKTISDISQQIQKYLAAKFVLSLLNSVCIGIVLWSFDVQFLFVWVALAFLLNFIPNIGSIIAVILPSLMLLIDSESIVLTVVAASIMTVIQNLIGNILEPKVLGEKLGLNPIVILISLLLWGYIWGIVGMFLSVPLAAIIKIIINNSESEDMVFISDLMGN